MKGIRPRPHQVRVSDATRTYLKQLNKSTPEAVEQIVNEHRTRAHAAQEPGITFATIPTNRLKRLEKESTENLALKEELQKTKAKLKKAEEDHFVLKETIQETRKELGSIKSELAKKDGRLDQQQARAEQAEECKKKAHVAYEQLVIDYNTQQEKHTTLRSSHQVQARELEQTRQEVDSLKDEIKRKEVALQTAIEKGQKALEKANAQATADYYALDENRENLQRANTTLIRQLNQMKRARSDWRIAFFIALTFPLALLCFLFL